MHQRERSHSAQNRKVRQFQLSPLYSRRGRSPPRLLKNHGPPPYYPGKEISTHYYEERSKSPTRLGKSKSPYSLERSRSPPQFLTRRKSPYYLERSSSPYFSDRRGGRNQSPSYYLEASEAPSLSLAIKESKTLSPPLFSISNLDQIDQNKSSPTLLETEENGLKNSHYYADKQQNDNGLYAVSWSTCRESAFYCTEAIKRQLNKPDIGTKKFTSVLDQHTSHYLAANSQATALVAIPSGQKVKEKVKSLEQVDKMTDDQIHSYNISGASKKRVRALESQGVPYIQAKRSIIKQNFIRDWNQLKPKSRMPSTSGPLELENYCTQVSNRHVNPDINDSSRINKHSLRQRPDKKQRNIEKCPEEVTIIQDGYPEVRMAIEELKTVQTAIMQALEDVDSDGPQVRFEKCQYGIGCLVLTCTDKTSAEWLKSVVSQLNPWNGAVLRTLAENRTLQSVKCLVYVPDENGEKLPAARILNRLSVSNKELDSHRWTILANTPVEKGHLWSFAMDAESLEMLKKVNMRPYFGFGSLKFRLQRDRAAKRQI